MMGKEYAETGITVNAIAPAVVRTPMVDAMPAAQVIRVGMRALWNAAERPRGGGAGEVHDGQDPDEAHGGAERDRGARGVRVVARRLVHDRVLLRRDRWALYVLRP